MLPSLQSREPMTDRRPLLRAIFDADPPRRIGTRAFGRTQPTSPATVSLHDLLARADLLLYEAKRLGRDNSVISGLDA